MAEELCPSHAFDSFGVSVIMKMIFGHRKRAFTFVEMCVVVVVLALLIAILLPALATSRSGSIRGICINHLKQVGLAYSQWAGNNGGLPPAQQSVARGGWADFLTNANQGAMCWTNYTIMGNDMGQSPKVVLCPMDERTNVASSFNHIVDKNNNPVAFNNTTLSYFVGVSANDLFPKSIIGGDRNLGSGVNADANYGYSPQNGEGNDVAVPTLGVVSWSLIASWSRPVPPEPRQRMDARGSEQ